MTLPVRPSTQWRTPTRSEHRCLGTLTSILFPLIHLLLELFCLLLINERQASSTVLELERMEKGPILVVRERVVDFLIPQDAAIGRLQIVSLQNNPENRSGLRHKGHYEEPSRQTYRYVDHLDPEGIPHQVICQHCGTLYACVRPSLLVGVCNIQPRNCDCKYFVGCFWDRPLHRLLVVV